MDVKYLKSGTDLSNYLQKNGVPGLILLLGDELYIQRSMAQSVENYFSQTTPGSIIRLNCADFDWNKLQNELFTFDMFCTNKLVVISGADPKFLRELSGKAQQLAEILSPNKMLLVLGPHLKKDTLSTGWFGKLAKINNYTVQFYPPNTAMLPPWLIDEARSMDLKLDARAAALLAESFEGNLGGAVQTLKTIKMQGVRTITEQQVAPFLDASTRFISFDISDALLAGDNYRALKILNSLKTQGESYLLLLKELNKIIQALTELKQCQISGEPAAPHLKALGIILPNKQNQYMNLATKIPNYHLNNLIRLFALINATRMQFNEPQMMRYIQILIALFAQPEQLDEVMSQLEYV